jgi:hypothetical protein
MRWIALCSAAIASAGCMTVGSVTNATLGAQGFSYTAGRATQDFAFPPPAMQSAVTLGMEDLRIHSIRKTNDSGALIFNGTTADNRRVQVAVRPYQAQSRLSIRIGWFGDEPLSRALMDRVGIRLGTLPPAAIPVDPPSSPEPNPYLSRDAIPDSTMLREQADAVYQDSLVPRADGIYRDPVTPQ